MSAEQLQEALSKTQGFRFGTTLDGYFLPKPLAAILEAGEQAHIPLLAGSNTQEQPARFVLGQGDPTPETLANAIRKFYGDRAGGVVKAYAAKTTDEVFEAAMHLAGARFISYGTWKWTEFEMNPKQRPNPTVTDMWRSMRQSQSRSSR
jgi:para-nitrobenzyl esterase